MATEGNGIAGVAAAVLEVRDATHRYGATVALDRVALSVASGECVALLGPNGAGKTTLVGLVTGLLRPQGGTRVRVQGGDPRVAATRRQLGAVLQTVGFPPTLTVREILRGAAVRAGRPPNAAGPIASEVGVTELLPRRATKLSGGQGRRVQLAMALVGGPALLVLDEPTAGLDLEGRRAFWQILQSRRRLGTAVLVTTHLIEEAAAVADRVVVLAAGHVVADDAPQALTARLPDRTVTVRSRLDVGPLAAMTEVASVRRDGPYLELTTVDAEAVVRRVLDDDRSATELRVEGVGLEDAVLQLTSRAVNAHPGEREDS